jgi:hypothetical protein
VKEFKVYRRVIESMTRLDLAENPIGTPQPRQLQQPRQPLQEYEVPVRGKRGIYYRRQKVKQLRENYRPVGAHEQQMPTAPQPQAQPQMPTAPRRPTEAELAIPQQPSEDFKRSVAKRTSTQGQTEQTTMEMIAKGKLPSGGQSGQGAQTTQGQGAAIAPEKAKQKLEDLHKAYIDEAESATQIRKHPKEYASYHTGLYEKTAWGVAPKSPAALAKIEDALGHPMLLGGLLTVAAGFPAYLETRAGYGKTTMAHALKQRIDSLYERSKKGDKKASRELAELPFADVVVIEPKSEIAELIGYLYVAPNRERDHDPSVVNKLANYLIAEGRAETMEEAMKLANNLLDESIDWMTGGSISGTTAIAPTEEIATALERASLWRMPNGKMAKPVVLVCDDAHTPTYWAMLETRLKTALAANTMYGMPYARVSYLFLANPNELNTTSEFASRLMPWITPADVTAQFGVRGTPTVSELIRSRGRKIAKAALRKVLGQSIDEIGDISKVLNDEKVVEKLKEQFDEEIRERAGYYGVLPDEEEELRKLPPEAYLTGGLGTPHYMDAIATAVSQAGLDAVTAGWHYRPDEEVDVDNIYSQYAGTPGFRAAYTDDELREVAERHAAFAEAVHRNNALATEIFSGKFEIPDWERVLRFINQHIRSRTEKINWFNERAAVNRDEPIDSGPDRTPRDWQRFTRLPALFGAMGRPDMTAYTVGMIGGIDPEVSMPDITVNDPPGEIEKKLDAYFKANNLSPSVQAMLKGQQLTPGEYAEGLKQYARAVIFTTQADGSAGEHTIYSILKPHVDTILQHAGGGLSTAPLAHQITRGHILPSDHTETSIYKEAQPSGQQGGQQGGQQKHSVEWYEAHEADFNKLLGGLYSKHFPIQVTDAIIQDNAEAAHTTLSILAGLMHSMHATAARGSQERNAILKSAKHARKHLANHADKPLLQHVGAAARMAAALGRYAEKGRYEDLTDDDKRELHKFAHQVAFAHQRKDENGNPAVSQDVKDLMETVQIMASSGSQAKTGASATGVGRFTPLTEKRWNPDFADTLAKVLTS